jgi:Transposase DDE domain group 1
MQTDCSTTLFEFAPVEERKVVASFDGGTMTSNAGALLLGMADKAIRLVERAASCFVDRRDPALIEHSVATLVGQRIFGLALGHEDLVDHDALRHDPLFAVLAGKLKARRADCAPVAGKSTLNRLERSKETPSLYHKISYDGPAIEKLLVDLFLEAHGSAPQEVVLDLDATDDPLHGEQEGRFFHGYYDCYCYLPLYVFCGDHLLVAKLRKADVDASAGAVEEIARVIGQIRARWPKVRIVLRADSGFAREQLMAWCEANGVGYLFGLAQNDRLNKEIAAELAAAAEESAATGKSARRFRDFPYRTRDSWSRERRVIGKAEWMTPSVSEAADTTQRQTKKAKKARRKKVAAALPVIPHPGRANPRFVVTSLSARECEGRPLYEKRYCARGEMENRIKECQLDLFADRTSSHTMRANQLRLWLASLAYVLMSAVRRIGLTNTRFVDATCGTIRLKLLKIGALVKISVRRILFSMASAFPYVDDYATAWAALSLAA